MTELLCKLCDLEIFENDLERDKYLATFRKKNDKQLYEEYTIDTINLDDFDKILSDNISHNNKRFHTYFFRLTYEFKNNKNITQCMETNCYSNFATQYIKSELLFYIDYFISRGFNFSHIYYITNNSIYDRCNMKDKSLQIKPLN